MTTEPLPSAALLRLLTWLSPSFPVGAFSYSHGLEWLVESGSVRDEQSLSLWVRDLVGLGSGRSDAILFTLAFAAAERNDMRDLAEIAELAAAFSPSAERQLETTAQGNAFATAVQTGWSAPTFEALARVYDGPLAYPVAVAVAAADHGLPVRAAALAYLHAFAANVISAGLRLIPLGQSSGQRILASLEEVLALTVDEVATASRSDLGGGMVMTDLASMSHETQYTRLFRS